MRQVLSLSLPLTDARQIKTLAKKRGYNSLSAYIKYLFKADEELISEDALLKTAENARREYHTGKAIRAKSIAELI